MHEAGERETKIKVTGRSFYRKNNLKFEGRNQNRNWSGTRTGTVDKKFGTRNRNLGKMARFRNTGSDFLFLIACLVRIKQNGEQIVPLCCCTFAEPKLQCHKKNTWQTICDI
jgi:hypothetical protein